MQFRCGECRKTLIEILPEDGSFKLIHKAIHYNHGEKCGEINEATFKDGKLVSHIHYPSKVRRLECPDIPEKPEVTE